MKKKIACCFLALSCLCMGGCGSDIPDMGENQTELITEYATHLLVKYGAESDTQLLNAMRLEEEMGQEEIMRERSKKMLEARDNLLNGKNKEIDAHEDEKKDPSSGPEEVPINEPSIQSLDTFFELPSFSVAYAGAELCDSYPQEVREDDFMSIEATSGKKLLVVSFSATNQTEEEQVLDLFGMGGRYFASVNGSEKIEAYTTLLLDDLSTYYGTLGAGETEELVLLFEVDAQEQVDSLALDVRQGDKSGTMVLQ